MKWINTVLWSALLGMMTPAFGQETVAETPKDYATGMTLETSGTSPWYQISLPLDVYQHSAWPDLRDVRVFNYQGERVPFALEVQKTQRSTPDVLPLRLFPLDISPIASTDTERTHSFLLRSRDGVEIHLETEDAKSIGQSYLLALPESSDTLLPLSQLRLNWATPAANWQGKASVYYSRDLQSWWPVQEDAPLMDLTRGDDRLKMDTISGSVTLSPQGNRYLLLILDTQTPHLVLNSVSAVAEAPQPTTERIMLDARAETVSETEALWQWDQPQPLTSLRIRLANDGVLPVELSWRSRDKEAWQPLTKTVLYQLNGKTQEDIPLSGALVDAIRITTINARLPETLPDVMGARDSHLLIFNAQGKGPYILAWGNRAAEKADVELAMLIPESLRKTQNMDSLPWAQPQERIPLGGEKRLTATSAAEQQSLWKSLLVWGALIIGVLVLLGMAWRIWREVKKGGSV